MLAPTASDTRLRTPAVSDSGLVAEIASRAKRITRTRPPTPLLFATRREADKQASPHAQPQC